MYNFSIVLGHNNTKIVVCSIITNRYIIILITLDMK